MAYLTKKQRKEATYEKTQRLFSQYDSFMVVSMDNVTALQLQTLKNEWRGSTEILLGKNTVILKALTELSDKKPTLKSVLPLLKENVAFVFTQKTEKELKDLMQQNSRDTYASVGQIAQKDVWVQKCITSMGPEKTKFFQALDIFTKITKGKVEITADVLVLKEGDKVAPSQANLLALMDIKAFTFFMRVLHVIEHGFVYNPWVIDITTSDIEKSIQQSANSLAALALATKVSGPVTVPFEMRGAYKKCLGLSYALGVSS